MYAKNRCLDDAELLFSELNERDLFSWTVNIVNYAQTDNLSPMKFTLLCCFRGCRNLRMLESGQKLHSASIKSELLSDTMPQVHLLICMENAGA